MKPETFWRKTKGMFGGDIRLRNTMEHYTHDKEFLRVANPNYVEKMQAREELDCKLQGKAKERTKKEREDAEKVYQELQQTLAEAESVRRVEESPERLQSPSKGFVSVNQGSPVKGSMQGLTPLKPSQFMNMTIS